MPVMKGETVAVIKVQDNGWVLVQRISSNDGTVVDQGFVPGNYIQLNGQKLAKRKEDDQTTKVEGYWIKLYDRKRKNLPFYYHTGTGNKVWSVPSDEQDLILSKKQYYGQKANDEANLRGAINKREAAYKEMMKAKGEEGLSKEEIKQNRVSQIQEQLLAAGLSKEAIISAQMGGGEGLDEDDSESGADEKSRTASEAISASKNKHLGLGKLGRSSTENVTNGMLAKFQEKQEAEKSRSKSEDIGGQNNGGSSSSTSNSTLEKPAEQEGYLKKLGGQSGSTLMRKWQKRYIVVRDGMCFYHKEKGADPQGSFSLTYANVKEASGVGKKYAMEIQTETRTWHFCADNNFEMGTWLNTFREHRKWATESTLTSGESSSSNSNVSMGGHKDKEGRRGSFFTKSKK
eukprot:TRINITY_DN439_c0_g1_i4.p1 TRINITY_DN439_c0_g1~~TRINITY_DN439_c0_g1_i4.p1  ORF type:complete len:402 (-),score=96.08 TRINITY_DN439_c0_g1_i4:3414-4619(-)